MENDRELLESVRSGDRKALEQLLGKYQASIFRFGAKMCGDPEDARDVLQETMLAAARTMPEFRGSSALSTWLYAIARSFCIKKRRTSKFAPDRVESLHQNEAEVLEVPDRKRTPEEDAAGHQLRAALDSAIAELEPMYREVLVLRDVEGLAAADVAAVMDISVEAVKSRLHRARSAVRERLAPLLALPSGSALPGPEPGRACRDVVEALSRRLEGEIDAGACAELEEHRRRASVERSVREALGRFFEGTT